MQGVRNSLSPDRATASSMRPKWEPIGRPGAMGVKPRGGSLLPPPVQSNEWTEMERPVIAEKRSTIQHPRGSIDDAGKKRLSQLGYQHLSPTRLQIQLSRAQERRLAEQSQRVNLVKNKRDEEINQMLGPIIRKPTIKNPKKPVIGPLTADYSAAKAQMILGAGTPTAANMACSAYLPRKLKKEIKQKQKATEAARNAHYRKASMTAQLETSFQKEMAAWKKARTDNVGPVQHKFYQGPVLRARLDEPSQERISVEVHHKNELVAQDTEVVETRNFETTLRNGD